jgi:hypothetical protein
MKKVLLISSLCAIGASLCAQISFPANEVRVDTLRPLKAISITSIQPLEVHDRLSVRLSPAPETFSIEVVDTAGYRNFAITKNGMLVAGTGHDPEVHVDGIALIGRNNAVKGYDSYAIGKGLTVPLGNAGAIGYGFENEKTNSLAIGYGDNRIEFSSDSGRFVGNWSLGSGGITAESDPTVPANVKAITAANISNWSAAYGWGNHATQGYLKSYTESDPIWSAEKEDYYTAAQLQGFETTSVNWYNLTYKPDIVLMGELFVHPNIGRGSGGNGGHYIIPSKEDGFDNDVYVFKVIHTLISSDTTKFAIREETMFCIPNVPSAYDSLNPIPVPSSLTVNRTMLEISNADAGDLPTVSPLQWSEYNANRYAFRYSFNTANMTNADIRWQYKIRVISLNGNAISVF